MKSKITRVAILILIGALLLGLPLGAGYIADEFDYSKIDPNWSYAWISVHHIVQTLMFIPFILFLKKTTKLKFGFTLGDSKRGMQYVLKFTIIFLVYTAIAFGIAFLTDTFVPFRYPMNNRNIFGALGFQLFLSGPSEEILFRAFGLTILGAFFTKRIWKGKFSVANLLMGIIFGLAHVGIFFTPFHLNFNLMQVGYAFVLGVVYGDCFEKTKSVFYPMMLHSISNVIAVGTTILLTLIF